MWQLAGIDLWALYWKISRYFTNTDGIGLFYDLTSWAVHADWVDVFCSNVVSDSSCLYDVRLHYFAVDGYNCRVQVESIEAIVEKF